MYSGVKIFQEHCAGDFNGNVIRENQSYRMTVYMKLIMIIRSVNSARLNTSNS